MLDNPLGDAPIIQHNLLGRPWTSDPIDFFRLSKCQSLFCC